MTPTSNVAILLNLIEDLLLTQSQDARDLVAILAALRGPDVDLLQRGHDPASVKARTTVVVRTRAFPRLAEQRREGGSPGVVPWQLDDLGLAPFPVQDALWRPSVTPPLGTHFLLHYADAIDALDRHRPQGDR